MGSIMYRRFKGGPGGVPGGSRGKKGGDFGDEEGLGR